MFAGRRIVLASSGMVYGDRPGRPADETDAPAPLLIARAALAAEEALAGPETRVVRLPWVCGPAGLARDVIVGLRVGRYRVVGPGGNRWALLGVEDAVDALLAAAVGPPAVYTRPSLRRRPSSRWSAPCARCPATASRTTSRRRSAASPWAAR